MASGHGKALFFLALCVATGRPQRPEGKERRGRNPNPNPNLETLFLFSRILPSLHVTLLNVPLITPHDKRGTSACRRAAPFDSFYEQMLYAFHVRWRHKLFAWLVVLVQMGQSALRKRNADVLRIRKGIRQNVENAPFSLHLVILNKMSGT